MSSSSAFETPTPGALGLYTTPDGQKRYPYFVSGDLSSDKAVIFMGGLYNGIGYVKYMPALGKALGKAGWKLVQPHWSSAYDGFATGSLDRDVSEMHALVNTLRGLGTRTIVVMGHSTGSQNVIHYLTTSTGADGGIMQASASDREHFCSDAPDTQIWKEQLPIATQLVESGKGDTLLDTKFANAVGLRACSAYRLYSLLSPRGDDDYFSSDLPTTADGVHKHPLDSSFGKLPVPAIALFSEKDEFAHVPDLPAMLAKWESISNGKLETYIVKGANHGVEDPAHWPDLCNAAVTWLKKHFP